MCVLVVALSHGALLLLNGMLDTSISSAAQDQVTETVAPVAGMLAKETWTSGSYTHPIAS